MGLYGALQQMKEQLEEDETELLDLPTLFCRSYQIWMMKSLKS